MRQRIITTPTFPIMKAVNYAKQWVRKVDLFSTSQFLRFKDDQDYKTVSGGALSIMVLTVFLVLFMSTAISTLNMTSIFWTSTSQYKFDPTPTSITTANKGSFMFAVGVLGVNLNSPTERFFDVTMIDQNIARGNVGVSKSEVNLVPCTDAHFSINQEIHSSFYSLPTYRWLCPPLNYSFALHGKYTSETMEYLQINLKKCNSSLDPSRPCVSDTRIGNLQQALGQFTMSFFFINPLINPGSQEYLSYYLQDRNYITFTRQLGAYSNGYIEDYQISTDISLLPFSNLLVDKGTIIPDLFQNIVYQVTNDNYASFYLMKSSRFTQYFRSFTKLDSFFSYVGGLVGTILGFMFIVSHYTQFSYELELSERLFTYTEDHPNDFSSSNIFHYVAYIFYQIFGCLQSCKEWKSMKQHYDCTKEIQKQLNVDFVLLRINFLEKAVESVLGEEQIQGIYNKKMDTLAKVKSRRKAYTAKLPQSKDSSQDSDMPKAESSNKVTNVEVQLNESIVKQMDSAFEDIERSGPAVHPEKAASQTRDRRRHFNDKKGSNLNPLRKQNDQANTISLKIHSNPTNPNPPQKPHETSLASIQPGSHEQHYFQFLT